MDCDRRSYFRGALPREACAYWRMVFASDPVETGFPAPGMSREIQDVCMAWKNREQEVPVMEATPPENISGFAVLRSQGSA